MIAITGAPGAGKSALAVQAAHASSHAFPDGQLYVNLQGATPGVERLKPIDVLGRLLRALGVPGEALPSDEDEAAAVLRDRLEGRRTLILLDDAAGPEQVRALLGLPSGNTVLITSRESHAATDDCVQLVLGRLLRSEAVTMLAKLVRAERIAADPAAADRLAHLCDLLPLALRLAAARLAERPDWTVRDLGTRLEDRRRTLHELESGRSAVRSSLELSYESLANGNGLDRLAARTMCHLGVLHVASLTAELVSALLGEPVDAAERALDRLARAHLVEISEPGRYRLHDLVRLFTIELADARLTPETRKDALCARSASTGRPRAMPAQCSIHTVCSFPGPPCHSARSRSRLSTRPGTGWRRSCRTWSPPPPRRCTARTTTSHGSEPTSGSPSPGSSPWARTTASSVTSTGRHWV